MAIQGREEEERDSGEKNEERTHARQDLVVSQNKNFRARGTGPPLSYRLQMRLEEQVSI